MLPLKDENPTTRRALVTLALIAVCVFAFFGPQQGTSDPQQALNFNLEYAAIPCEITQGEPLSETEAVDTFVNGDPQACGREGGALLFPNKNVYLGMLTSIFLHGSLSHIVGNMWFLWLFGNNIEDRLGHFWYLLFYVGGGLAADIAHIMVQPSSTVPVVGASGAIAAIMGAYLVWFPNAPIRTLIVLYLRDIRAFWFLGFWFFSQFLTAPSSGVAWVAHVGGFVFGLVVAGVVRVTAFGIDKIDRSGDSRRWDSTGGAGHGPLPHPFENRPGRT